MEQSYKEKYEDILARLERAKNDNEVCDERFCCVIDDLIPELAESEDEKIRNGLVRLLKELLELGGVAEDEWDRNECEKYIAWLEKQKENIGGISPNPAWSEEDEENFCSVYLDVKSARQNTVNSLSGELKEQEQKRMDEVISWLESLKGRVLPKQEWSEEDEQHVNSLLKRLDALCRNKFERTRFAISEDRDWLKSLRTQNQWKPSEEQMNNK